MATSTGVPIDLTQVLTLPFVPSIPFYQFSTTLDGVNYNFNVRWNTRDGAWYFDLSDDQENLIIAGVKIVLGVALARRSTDPRMPPGVFFAGDVTNSGTDAGIDDLGARVQVYYYPAAQWFADPAVS